MDASYVDRCIGCLLGKACGDVLGAAVEGWPSEAIRQAYGQLRDFQQTSRGFGCYTDDTQMALTLAESLVEQSGTDAAHVSARYAEHYEPWRGYGAGAHVALQALRNGADYRTTGRIQFPDGSFGNGGAMRIAPVGLAYRHASVDVLRAAVADALYCTHVHPEGVDGALVQAMSVARVAKTRLADFDPEGLLRQLMRGAQTEIMRRKLAALAEGLRDGRDDHSIVAEVGHGVRASEAVAASLCAFLRYGSAPEECVIRAIEFGGDTDTIGAMTGALVGALHGRGWIPGRWWDHLENGHRGRDWIVDLARRLANLDVRGSD